MEESQKVWVEGGGGGCQGGRNAKGFFKIKGMKNPISGTLVSFKQPLTKYSLLCFILPEEQTRLRQRSIATDFIILTTKVAHIIIFLSGHMCLSTWAGAVVSN